MKIGILSDIHGNAIAFEHAINDLKKLGINKIILLGDYVLKGPMPHETIEILKNCNLEILSCIKGNTDLYIDEREKKLVKTNKEDNLYTYYKFAKRYLSQDDLIFLEELHERDTLNIKGYSVLCVHGTPNSIVEAIDKTVDKEDIRNAIKNVDEDIILSGHSHTSYIGEVDNKKIFNVGSTGNSLDGNNNISYGILDFSDDKVKLINRRIKYPFEEIIKIAEKRDFPKAYEYQFMIMNGTM